MSEELHEHTTGDCCSTSKPHLTEKQAISKLQYLDGWVILEEKNIAKLNKTYLLSDFQQIIEFLTQIELVTREFKHQPDIETFRNIVSIKWHTYSANGLTDLDFAAAEACDALYAEVIRG